MRIGFHVSISGSIDKSVDRALELGCNTFQIFTGNPRTWATRELGDEEIEFFKMKVKAAKMKPVFSHVPYITNLSSPNEEIFNKSIKALEIESRKCSLLGIPYLVTHLGSHIRSGKENGKKRIIEALCRVADKKSPKILIENSSGSGGHMGSMLEDLDDIINEVGNNVGVCFDTCHAYAAGYNVSKYKDLNLTLKRIKATIGLGKINLVHLNDSTGDLGSGVDHHEHIGLGRIGENGFKLFLKSSLALKPMIMETPNDNRRSDSENMRIVKRLFEI